MMQTNSLQSAFTQLSHLKNITAEMAILLRELHQQLMPLGESKLRKADLPELRLKGRFLLVGEVPIPCAGRPMTWRLLSAFFENNALQADRDLIMRYVYGDAHLRSERLQQSLYCNLNKLISRTRRFLADSLMGIPGALNVEWFVFDHKEKVWKLLMFRPMAEEAESMSIFIEEPKAALLANRVCQEASREI